MPKAAIGWVKGAGVWVLSVLLGLGSAASRAETLVMAADPWCPINCEPGSERPGIFVELARAVFAEAGIAIEYRTLNWARALQETRQGHLNAVIGAGLVDAPDFIFTPTPIAHSQQCFYTLHTSRWRFRGLPSLEEQRLGIVNEYGYGSELNSYIARHAGNAELVQSAAGERALEQNVVKLLGGRLDILIEDAWVMENKLRELALTGQIREAGCLKPAQPIFIAFSPALANSPDYRQILEEGIRRYRENGRWQALLERYGVSEER